MNASKLPASDPDCGPLVTRSGGETDSKQRKDRGTRTLKIGVREVALPKDTSPQLAQIFLCK